jgi:hypothetical protein
VSELLARSVLPGVGRGSRWYHPEAFAPPCPARSTPLSCEKHPHAPFQPAQHASAPAGAPFLACCMHCMTHGARLTSKSFEERETLQRLYVGACM